MDKILAQTTEPITTETVYSWINIPMAVALFFALAGTFFIGIYIIRRLRSRSLPKE